MGQSDPYVSFLLRQATQNCLSIMGITQISQAHIASTLEQPLQQPLAEYWFQKLKEMGHWKSSAFQLHIRSQKIVIPAIWHLKKPLSMLEHLLTHSDGCFCCCYFPVNSRVWRLTQSSPGRVSKGTS